MKTAAYIISAFWLVQICASLYIGNTVLAIIGAVGLGVCTYIAAVRT